MPVVDIRTRLSPNRLIAVGIAIVVLVVALVVVVWRANAGLSTNGPMGDGGDTVEGCAPVPPGHAVTTASYRLRNVGSKAVVLDSFAPIAPTGIKVLGSAVVGVGSGGSIGLALGYPPSRSSWPQGFLWDQRRPVEGTSIPPQSASVPPHFTLAVGLVRSGSAPATVSGFKVKYHVKGGSSYLLMTHETIRLATNCDGQ
jgi:hypothetical protein